MIIFSYLHSHGIPQQTILSVAPFRAFTNLYMSPSLTSTPLHFKAPHCITVNEVVSSTKYTIFSDNFLKLKIRFDSFTIEEYVQEPAYTIFSLICKFTVCFFHKKRCLAFVLTT